MTAARALVRAARPRQWAKNVLVLAAPVAAGVAFQPSAVLPEGLAVVAFTLASSGVYLVNDTIDLEDNRAHPTKRFRPVASGELSERAAVAAAAVFLTAGLVVAALVGWQLLGVVALYEVAMVLYSLGLKHIPVIELLVVAFGFLLRALAGGVATNVALSSWFLTVVGFGALFVVAGKRFSEMSMVADAPAAIRPVLARYTPSYLRFAWTLSAGAMVMTYALWASSLQGAAPGGASLVSAVPVVAAVLRYAMRVDAGEAGEPEEVILRDRVLLALVAAWAAWFLYSVYL